jgi:hypothetical protein
MADLSFNFDPSDMESKTTDAKSHASDASSAASDAISKATAASSAAATLKKNVTDLDATPDSDHSAIGPQCNDINAGESITVMDCVYLHSDGEWHKTDADAAATADGLLAISLESKTDGNAMNVAMPGCFVRDDTWAWTVGGKIYLDTVTAGGLTQTAPSGTDDVVRIVGYATHADRMYLFPEQTIVVHT